MGRDLLMATGVANKDGLGPEIHVGRIVEVKATFIMSSSLWLSLRALGGWQEWGGVQASESDTVPHQNCYGQLEKQDGSQQFAQCAM